MNSKLILGLAFSLVTAHAFALPETQPQPLLGEAKGGSEVLKENGFDRTPLGGGLAEGGSDHVLERDRVAEDGFDRTRTNQVAEDGYDRTLENRVAEDGSDRTGVNRVAEGGSDRLLERFRVAEDGYDRTLENRVAEDGFDRTGANRVAEGGADRLLERHRVV